MAGSLYKDDVDEILALARLAQRHAEYESDEELDVFGGDRTDVEPPVTMAPHGSRSGPGDWVSEDLDLVAPEFQEAPKKKHMREGWKRKQGDETKQPEAKKVKRDTKRETKTDATAKATAEATTAVPGEHAPWKLASAQIPQQAISAAPQPPPRRGQLVDIKVLERGATPAGVLPMTAEAASQAPQHQLKPETYHQLPPAPPVPQPPLQPVSTFYPHDTWGAYRHPTPLPPQPPPPVRAPRHQGMLGHQVISGAYRHPAPLPPPPVPAHHHQAQLEHQLTLGTPHQLPPAPPPAVAPPIPTPSPAPPPTQAKPKSAHMTNLENAIRGILKQNFVEVYPIAVRALLAAAAKDPHLPVVLNAVMIGRATGQQWSTFRDFVKVVETKWGWKKQGGPR
jgi:hypothetical protein